MSFYNNENEVTLPVGESEQSWLESITFELS